MELTHSQKQEIIKLQRSAVYEKADDLDRTENFIEEMKDRLRANLKYMESEEIPAWFKFKYETLQSIPPSAYWSENQLKFINDVEETGEHWFYYSGRGMDGDVCPAARNVTNTRANVCQDSLGMDIVCYAQY